MRESEVAETLMSLSAPDDRRGANALHAAGGLPWHHAQGKKRSFQSFDVAGTSLPTASLLALHRRIRERPLTSLIPQDDDEDEEDSDVAMSPVDDDDGADEDEDRVWSRYRSPLDGLVAAARDQEEQHRRYGSSAPIAIPVRGGGAGHRFDGVGHASGSFGKKPKWLSGSPAFGPASAPVGGLMGQDGSPTGIEDDDAWYDGDYRQRARLASVCSSEGSCSEYGGLGRQHLEEFIRMEISENDSGAGNYRSSLGGAGGSPPGEGKFIGSYSPEARRKRIERFLEKRKRRVWAKKVDYDVRKNFANSRLRVKGRFVKKEDEELLCHLLSYT